MKTVLALIAGFLCGAVVSQTASNITTNPAPAPANASATPAPAGGRRGGFGGGGGGSNLHPVSKNITERLTQSPRHQEFVKIKQGDRDVNTFVVYPAAKDKAMAVVLIHEIYGLSDWVKAAADQLAEDGYIVLVPDLLSGTGPGKGGSETYTDTNVTAGVSALPADQVNADLNAVVNYAEKQIPSCNGKVAVAGFCWGGGKAFTLATVNKDIKAAFVFYGTVPPEASLANITAPVYGFFPETDARTAIPGMNAVTAMKAAGKTYEPITYAGAAHGFMRLGQMDNATAANKQAAEDSWKRMLDLLAKINGAAAPAADAKAAASTTPAVATPAAG